MAWGALGNQYLPVSGSTWIKGAIAWKKIFAFVGWCMEQYNYQPFIYIRSFWNRSTRKQNHTYLQEVINFLKNFKKIKSWIEIVRLRSRKIEVVRKRTAKMYRSFPSTAKDVWMETCQIGSCGNCCCIALSCFWCIEIGKKKSIGFEDVWKGFLSN